MSSAFQTIPSTFRAAGKKRKSVDSHTSLWISPRTFWKDLPTPSMPRLTWIYTSLAPFSCKKAEKGNLLAVWPVALKKVRCLLVKPRQLGLSYSSHSNHNLIGGCDFLKSEIQFFFYFDKNIIFLANIFISIYGL